MRTSISVLGAENDLSITTEMESLKCESNADKASAKLLNVHDSYKNQCAPIPRIAHSLVLPYCLMIYNCHGDFNIGTLVRTGTCLAVQTVFTVGRRKFDRRTLVGGQNYTKLVRLDDLGPDPVSWFRDQGMFPVFIEQGGSDISECDFRQFWSQDNEGIPCLVVGSECDGLPEDFIASFPDCPRLSIGQPGVIRSLNVACAGSMAMERIYYAWRRQTIDRYGLL